MIRSKSSFLLSSIKRGIPLQGLNNKTLLNINNNSNINNNETTLLNKYYTSNCSTTKPYVKQFSSESLWNKISDNTKKLVENLQTENTLYLSRLITLIESTRDDHQEQARMVVSYLLQRSKENNTQYKSFRIGISGPPGAGKSTFIEAFGKHLTSLNHKVAVLAIDPSSVRSGGSVLGDKTRMVELSVDPNAYVRPSSTRGSLGGICKSTSDTIVLCESAGFDVVLVETVGVGQSEVSIDEMIDIFVLLVPPANGDELQGLKKGIMESADLIVVNKADGELLPKARFTVSEYMSALKLQRPKSENWKATVISCSSLSKEGIDNVWNMMMKYKDTMLKCGEFKYKRSLQKETFMKKLIDDEIVQKLWADPNVQRLLPSLEAQVREGNISPSLASINIINEFLKDKKD
ncbi:hypothetical protein CYY_009188 [Polysphondylium violaceum]|uniref:Methylmalonic aciduria type A protein n=1 Tax=Polysphondylium violaceum TaxID=133409 RepID=A0A8J4PKE9_9MYCE|nr:hypothetical protein CYY_009188 [Polysphondylium violaceum]